MLELPEAQVLARQINETSAGKAITHAAAATSPHGFAFYSGDPALYGGLLAGKKITGAHAYGGRADISVDGLCLSLNDGVNVRYLAPGARRPEKHQLLLELEDGSAIVCTVQMYGGLALFADGENDSFYYTVAKTRPSPLSDAFDENYFASLLASSAKKLSAKAFLATEQRIPGLGNGVLQDILWRAKIHPKRKMSTLSENEFGYLFCAVKAVLTEMTESGGRDTEKDLFGNAGGYITVMSRTGSALPCPECGGIIRRMAYLGGNVYVCESCQRPE